MDQKLFQVFRAGDYGKKGSYSAADISVIADRYDPAFLEAPITIDHSVAGPAWGWVEKAHAEGDILLVGFKDIVEEFREAVDKKQYKRVSIEIFKNLDIPGKGPGPYLKAVSFLGAAAPQVKGLDPVAFSAPGDVELVTIEFSDENPQQMVLVAADEYQAMGQSLAEMSARFKDLEKQVAKFSVSEEERQRAVERLRQLHLTNRKNSFKEWLNEQVVYGSLSPAEFDDVMQILECLDAVVSFSDDGTIENESAGTGLLKKFITGLGKRVSTVPIATKTATPDHDDLHEFADMPVDPDRAILFKEAKRLQREKNISFDQALDLAEKTKFQQKGSN